MLPGPSLELVIQPKYRSLAEALGVVSDVGKGLRASGVVVLVEQVFDTRRQLPGIPAIAATDVGNVIGADRCLGTDVATVDVVEAVTAVDVEIVDRYARGRRRLSLQPGGELRRGDLARVEIVAGFSVLALDIAVGNAATQRVAELIADCQLLTLDFLRRAYRRVEAAAVSEGMMGRTVSMPQRRRTLTVAGHCQTSGS